MSNRLFRPVMFAAEPDVVFLFASVTFGASGAPTLNQTSPNTSKGFCSVTRNNISITGNTTAQSNIISGVNSFANLYVGMSISDNGTNIQPSTTIVALNANSGTIEISQPAIAGNNAVALTVAGGLFTFTFGRNLALNQLDTYVKCLNVDVTFSEQNNAGGVSTGASAPAAGEIFLVQNNLQSSSLANIWLQHGVGNGSNFVAVDPDNGSIGQYAFCLGRSTAV